MSEMLGYDKHAAMSEILPALQRNARIGGYQSIIFSLSSLVPVLIDAHIDYLHACGALDDTGDTGDGSYDEDEAFEVLLDAVSEGKEEDELTALANLVEAFLPAQDEFMLRAGLLSE